MAGRGGTSKSKGSMGKGGGRKKNYVTGAIGELQKRRAARKAAGKWTLGEKLKLEKEERNSYLMNV